MKIKLTKRGKVPVNLSLPVVTL